MKRLICALALALAAMLVTAGAAHAILVFRINQRTVTGSAAGFLAEVEAAPGVVHSINCAVSEFNAAITLETFLIPSGDFDVIFCPAGYSITQTAPWTARATALLAPNGTLTGLQVRISVPVGGVRVVTPLCTFTAGGVRTTLLRYANVPLGAPIAIPFLDFASAEWGMRVDATAGAGCAVSGIGVGDRVDFDAYYILTPELTGTLVTL